MNAVSNRAHCDSCDSSYETDLHADSQVDPGAEGGADSTRRQAKIFEELGEGLRESKTRALLGDHHTAPHARQIHSPRLKRHTQLVVRIQNFLFSNTIIYIIKMSSFIWPYYLISNTLICPLK